MSEHNITVAGGSSARLKTAGKYCDRDIVVTAEGGKEDLNDVLAEQEGLIAELKDVLCGKASGGGGSVDNGILPIGYTPVPSIKFTGEQAVDTGIICNQDTQIRVVFTVEDNKGQYIYGVANADNTASLTAYRSASGGRWRFGNQNNQIIIPANDGSVWGVQVDKKRISRCNTTSVFDTVSDFTTTGTMVLGGGRLATGIIEESTRFVGKIVVFEIYAGDEPVLSFVPCKNVDGVCGFWDTVSQQFSTTISDTPLEWSFL